jgi:hypothetical protein
LGLGLGANYSFLTYDDKKFKNRFPNNEYRLELIASLPVNTTFAISTGLRLGRKQSTNSLFPFLPIELVGIDKALSSRNHYFSEVPLRLVYMREKISIGLGGLLKYYFKISDPNEYFLSDKFEFGISPNLTYKIYDKVELASELYFGLTPILKFIYNDQGNFKSLSTFDNYFGISVRYKMSSSSN